MKLEFTENNTIEMPELILGIRNYDKLGSLNNIENFVYERHLMSANMIHVSVYKELNGRPCTLWEEIKDNRLLWVKEFNEWFQISVSADESEAVVKTITGTALCEAELGQLIVHNTGINTEDDIARDDYEPTVFYNSNNHEASLLHRLLKTAPHYTVKYVSPTLANIQRTFSIDGSSLYDTLTNEIATEIGCLFIFDSTDRSLSVYDLYKTCTVCGYRGEYDDLCPDCGSSSYMDGYGEDTAILVDRENLANTLTVQGLSEEVKNCFRLVAGDDYMTDTVININPNGSPYIYHFSERDLEDMSEELTDKLAEYNEFYEQIKPAYLSLTGQMYAAIDKVLELKSTMMPDIKHAKSNAALELAKLTSASLSPVSVSDVSSITAYTANNAVLAMAKCVANGINYKITILDGATLSGQTWRGRFRVENYSDSEDAAESISPITVQINDDYENFARQKIQKSMDRDDTQLVDMLDISVPLSDFKSSLKLYCLARLESFQDAYQSALDILVGMECGNTDAYPDIYNSLYLPHKQRLDAIEAEIKVRAAEIEKAEAELDTIDAERTSIQQSLNMENFVSETLWKELRSFTREDTYENANYISDGLSNSEVIKKAEEFLETAEKEIYTASTLQFSLSADMNNLLVIPEFEPLLDYFDVGNRIRVRADDVLYKLRLASFTIDFGNIQNISVEFSDVTKTCDGSGDVKGLMDKLKSMTTSYNYVAHQASQGAKGYDSISDILEEGLNASLYKIQTSDSQDFVIDSHGILGRTLDDITETYSPEQIRIINNLICFTDDNWSTVKTALGNITYTHPLTGKRVDKYGLLADTVIAGTLIGNDIIGGNIYSANYSASTGTHLNLEDGSFSFAGGKLKYDPATNVLSLSGTVTASHGNIGGFIITESSLYNGTSSLNTANATKGIYLGTDGFMQYESADAYVKISNGTLTANNADIKGSITTDDIEATGGTIGGFTIGETAIYYNNTNSLTSKNPGIYLGNNGIYQYASNNAYVRISNGILEAKGVNISGTITTNNATITGGSLKVGNNFSVSNTGELTASNATINGTIVTNDITVTGGSITLGNTTITPSGFRINTDNDSKNTNSDSVIAGWKILYNRITKNTVGISHDPGNYAFWAGGTESGTDPKAGVYSDDHDPAFAVTQEGKVIAKDITITAGTVGGLDVVEDSGKRLQSSYTFLAGTSSVTNTFRLNGNTSVTIAAPPIVMALYTSTQNALFKLTADGQLTAPQLNTSSSRRFKENIHEINSELLDNLLKIKTYEFDYKPEMGGRKNCLGVIAEEIMNIYPNAVLIDNDNLPEAVNYTYFIPLLINKVQLLQAEIESLKKSPERE